VAVEPGGRRACHVQWLVTSREADRVLAHWGDLFPRLRPDEALGEASYTAPAYRGQGLMAHAAAHIAQEAGRNGSRWVIGFVNRANIPMLKALRRAGFSPYVERTESWSWFRRRVSFRPLRLAARYPSEARSTGAQETS
jgi:GNAT superfamily N-acetyltransferase